MAEPDDSHHKSSLGTLTLGALGVVFGDIGTSPLYAFKEAFAEHGLPLTEANVLAVLSMMFWTITLIVSLKYVSIVLRFDNCGEGGILAFKWKKPPSSLARPPWRAPIIRDCSPGGANCIAGCSATAPARWNISSSRRGG